MATPARSPFCVPKPRDFPEWNWKAPPSGAITVTRTQVKFYGQPGQSPTKRWEPHYRHYESPSWYWSFKTPYNLALAQRQFPDEQNWRFNQPNDPGVWQWCPHRNTLVSVRPFPSRAWHYDYNDASVWTGEPTRSLLIEPILSAGGQPPTKSWRYDYSEVPFWSWQVPTFKVVSAPFVSEAWHYDYNDASLWVGQSRSSALLAQLLTAGGRPPTKTWRYDYDQSVFWQPFQVPNANLLGTLTVAPFVSKGWHYDLDDAAFWTWQAPRRSIPASFYGAIGQVPTKVWHYDYNDASLWTGQSRSSALLAQLLTAGGQPPTKHWAGVFDYDAASNWQWQAPFNINVATFVATTPFVSLGWHLDYDDSAFWTWTPPSSFYTLEFAQPPAPTRRAIGRVIHAVKPLRWWELLEAEHSAQIRAENLESDYQREVAEEALARVEEATAAIAVLETETDEAGVQVKRLTEALDNFRRARKSKSIISRAHHLSAIAQAATTYARNQEEEEAVVMLLLM